MNMNGTHWISHNVLTDALSVSYILDHHRFIIAEEKIKVPSRAQTLSQKACNPDVHWPAARPRNRQKRSPNSRGDPVNGQLYPRPIAFEAWSWKIC
ncbi:hypothetical protein RGCCGE502_16895 [Rhizobium grahamii CCGE 502]|uniref:Uncharacterized protein n=1 Tax=Rhizobium grahamii CCGE 502 TaxID=990285 RepID=S3HV54_9HYPH|nr:hypothetical protein RGCCGE502_16895 [Rhizobium grahamii CCGE 502]